MSFFKFRSRESQRAQQSSTGWSDSGFTASWLILLWFYWFWMNYFLVELILVLLILGCTTSGWSNSGFTISWLILFWFYCFWLNYFPVLFLLVELILVDQKLCATIDSTDIPTDIQFKYWLDREYVNIKWWRHQLDSSCSYLISLLTNISFHTNQFKLKIWGYQY